MASNGNGTISGKGNGRVAGNEGKGKGQQKGKGKGKRAQVGSSGKRHQVVYAYSSVPGDVQYGAHILQQYRQKIPIPTTESMSKVDVLKRDAGSKCLVTPADRASCV